MKRAPADETEHGVAVDVMRAALATIVHSRKQPVVLTARRRSHATGIILRVLYDTAGTITLWTEPAPDDMRRGVTYVTDASRSRSDAEEPR